MRHYAFDEKIATPAADAEPVVPTPGKATLTERLVAQRGLSRTEVEAMIAAALAGGVALPPALAAQLAQASGRSFQAHTGAAATKLARAAGEPVVAVEDHVVLDRSVDPASPDGAAAIRAAAVGGSAAPVAAPGPAPAPGGTEGTATASVATEGTATATATAGAVPGAAPVAPGAAPVAPGAAPAAPAVPAAPASKMRGRSAGAGAGARTSARSTRGHERGHGSSGRAAAGAGGGSTEHKRRSAKGGKPAVSATHATAGGTAQATAAPAAAPTPASAPTAANDTLVDAWMEGHFSDQRVHELASTIGALPEAPSVVSPIDRAIPVGITNPAVRGGIELIAGIGLGMFDAAFWAVLKSLPAAGPAFAILDGIRNGLETGQAFADAGAPLGGVVAEVRVVLDVASAIAGNLGGWVDVGSAATFAAGTAAGALGFAVGLVAPPIGLGIEAFAAICFEAYAGLSLAQAGLSAGSSVIGQIMTALDAILIIHDAVLARRAEAAGDFERAGKLKALMQGSTLDLVTDGIGAAIDAVSAISAAFSVPLADKLAKEGIDVLIHRGIDLVDNVLDGDVLTKLKALRGLKRMIGLPAKIGDGLTPTLPVGPGTEDPLLGGAGGVSGDPLQDLINVGVPGAGITFGDEMRTSTPYVDTSRATPAPGPIGQARRATVGTIDTTWAALGAQRIDWFQGLVDEILGGAPPTNAGDVADMMQPSHWILAAVEGLTNFINASGGAGSAQAIAAGAATVGGWIGAAQPVLDGTAAFIQQIKPRLDTLVGDVAGQIAKTRISLDGMRGALGQAESAAAQIGAALDQQSQITAVHQQLDSTLAAIKVDRASLGLPASIPVPGADGQLDAMLAEVTAPVTALRGLIAQLKTTAIDPMQAKILAVRAEVDAQLAAVHTELAAGGAVETELLATEAKVKAIVAEAATAFQHWDGGIPIDLQAVGAALTELGAAATTAAQSDTAAPTPAPAAPQAEDPWRVAAKTEGQPFIETWRGVHEAQLRSIYQPTVSEAEIAACQAAHDAALPKAGRYASALATTLARCLAYRGATGRDAVYGLWAAEDALLGVVKLIDSPPPDHGAPPPPR